MTETNKSGRDNRGKGILRYIGERYLKFDNGEYFLKGGADSPENYLGYKDFDNTYSMKGELKHYNPHVQDWKEGDPVWHGDKGKGMIGSLNYLASTGAKTFSFITMNVDGDGQDVWPWTDPNKHDRYNVSKLDQWQIVFSHADTLGFFLHFKTQETENDLLLNNGDLGFERKLYYRELIARFGHHLALNSPTTTHFAQACYGETCCLVGGYQGTHPGRSQNKAWCFDRAKITYTTLPDLPGDRAGGGLSIITDDELGNRFLLYAGGMDRTSDSYAEHIDYGTT